jgi:integrase
VARLDPPVMRAAIGGWRTAGVTQSVISGRFRTLRAALGWAYEHRLVDRNPIEAMRGPPRPQPRLRAPEVEVIVLVRHAERSLEKTRAEEARSVSAVKRMHRAEQLLLLVRLAADTGARRGELAALKMGDLEGRVLHIARGVSVEQLGPTKTGRTRRLTVGMTTATLWHDLVETWAVRLPEGVELGEWLFSADLAHRSRLSTSYLAHLFGGTRVEAGVPSVTMHSLRHSVATFLVDRGEILKAQQRLGHKDPSTTLRNYAHALPLEDQDVADALDAMLGRAEREP